MGRVQTTQVTGKGWKGLQALGCMGSLAGIAAFFVAASMVGPGRSREPAVMANVWGISLLMIGLSVYFFGRVGAWWHHG